MRRIFHRDERLADEVANFIEENLGDVIDCYRISLNNGQSISTMKEKLIMTRNDARMIAEELFKLQCETKTEPLIGTDEAISFTGIPKGTFNKVINEIPHMKLGKRNYFRKSELSKWMER